MVHAAHNVADHVFLPYRISAKFSIHSSSPGCIDREEEQPSRVNVVRISLFKVVIFTCFSLPQAIELLRQGVFGISHALLAWRFGATRMFLEPGQVYIFSGLSQKGNQVCMTKITDVIDTHCDVKGNRLREGIADRAVKILGLIAKIRVVHRRDVVYKSEWPGDEAPWCRFSSPL